MPIEYDCSLHYTILEFSWFYFSRVGPGYTRWSTSAAECHREFARGGGMTKLREQHFRFFFCGAMPWLSPVTLFCSSACQEHILEHLPLEYACSLHYTILEFSKLYYSRIGPGYTSWNTSAAESHPEFIGGGVTNCENSIFVFFLAGLCCGYPLWHGFARVHAKSTF